MEETLFLEPLLSALASLEDILKQPMDEYRRDGAIQRFEYTFELVWKTLQRALELEGVVAGSPKQVLQAAVKTGLITGLDIWVAFLKARNLSVHTYNRKIAEQVYLSATVFPPYVRDLLNKLKDK